MLPTFIVAAVGMFSGLLLGVIVLVVVFKKQKERRYQNSYRW